MSWSINFAGVDHHTARVLLEDTDEGFHSSLVASSPTWCNFGPVEACQARAAAAAALQMLDYIEGPKIAVGLSGHSVYGITVSLNHYSD